MPPNTVYKQGENIAGNMTTYYPVPNFQGNRAKNV